MANKTYDWKITAKKFFILAAEVVLSGLLVYFTDNTLYLGLIPIIEAVRNFVKHIDK
jgi:hypothetical protein